MVGCKFCGQGKQYICNKCLAEIKFQRERKQRGQENLSTELNKERRKFLNGD